MIVSPNYVAYEEARGCKYRIAMLVRGDKKVEFVYSTQGNISTKATKEAPWANIELTKDDTLVCKSHKALELGSVDATGLYYCQHFAALALDSSADAQFFDILVGHHLSKASRDLFSLNIQIHEDVFRKVNFHQQGDHLAVQVDGHDTSIIGVVTPKYEGLSVVREMVREHYEMWTLASKTMCTGSSHWKSKSAELTIKDRLVLDVEKMCYPCVRRSADAMLATQHPENEVGFASLPKSTPLKSPLGPSGRDPARAATRPIPLHPSPGEEPLSPFAGGPSTTAGSVRVNPKTGIAEVYDGNGNWIVRGTVTLAPDSVSLFHSAVDEREWNNFMEYRDGEGPF